MPTQTATPLGIRDRKRLETRERADVSPRTFSNYFDSKDSAILGIHQRALNDELMSDHATEYAERQRLDLRPATSHDLVASVVRLLFTVMGAPLASRVTLQADRIEVLKRHPEVLSGQFAQLTARADRLVETIGELMSATPGFGSDTAERRAQAELLLSLSGGAIRVAVRECVADDGTDIDHIENRALALTDQIVGKLG